jgi:hypothetical protein
MRFFFKNETRNFILDDQANLKKLKVLYCEVRMSLEIDLLFEIKNSCVESCV